MDFFDLHTHCSDTHPSIIAIHNVYPEILSGNQELPTPFSCGIHPWFITPDLLPLRYSQSEVLLANPACVAVGEAGLDKNSSIPMQLQLDVFRQMIAYSEKYRKPLIVHCVKAYDQLIALRKQMRPVQPWILHGFRGKPELARQLTAQGFYLSFGQQFNEQTLRSVEPDCFFLETDDGNFNISTLYQQVASLRNIPLHQLVADINLRARQLFGSDLFQNLLEK